MKKLVILGNPRACERDIERFNAAGIEVIRATYDNLAEQSKGAQVILTYGLGLKRDRIEQLDSSVKAIVQMFIGLDNFDADACTERGIMLCNNPDYGTEEVAAMAIALFMTALRKTTIYDRQMKAGVWTKMYENNNPYPARRLSCLTFGVIGFGGIGRNAARMGKGLGMKVIAYDPYCPEQVFEDMGVEKVTLDEIWARSDAITLHSPLTPETYHTVNAETIAKMKDKVIIINTSRGAVVDEPALIEALKTGKVAAAGLDVFEKEPLPEDSPLKTIDTAILAPHTAFHTTESFNDIENLSGDIAMDIFEGKIPRSCVNRKALGL